MLYDRVVDNKEVGRKIWKICTAFNTDLNSVERFVLRWTICTTLSDMYYVEWFVIQENTVRYFALTSGLTFPWFGNIKNIRPCPTNWSNRDVFNHSCGNYYQCIFQTYLTTSWTNLALHFLTWCNYVAQLHPSLGKVKGKGKFLLSSK